MYKKNVDIFFYDRLVLRKALKFNFYLILFEYALEHYVHIIMYIIILVEKSAGIIIVNVELKYNDVRVFSIESVKKTNAPSGLY